MVAPFDIPIVGTSFVIIPHANADGTVPNILNMDGEFSLAARNFIPSRLGVYRRRPPTTTASNTVARTLCQNAVQPEPGSSSQVALAEAKSNSTPDNRKRPPPQDSHTNLSPGAPAGGLGSKRKRLDALSVPLVNMATVPRERDVGLVIPAQPPRPQPPRPQPPRPQPPRPQPPPPQPLPPQPLPLLEVSYSWQQQHPQINQPVPPSATPDLPRTLQHRQSNRLSITDQSLLDEIQNMWSENIVIDDRISLFQEILRDAEKFKAILRMLGITLA